LIRSGDGSGDAIATPAHANAARPAIFISRRGFIARVMPRIW